MAKRNKHMTPEPNSSGEAVPDEGSKGNAPVHGGMEELTFKKISGEGDVTIRTLVADLGAQLGYKSDRVISRLMQLQSEGKIKVMEKNPSGSLASYGFSANALWFWAAVIATILSIFSIYITSGAALYARYLLGGALILFLPGYSLTQFLFARRQDMEDDLTRVALSIGLSIAIVPLLGLVLNYTPYGIRLIPIAIALGAFTGVFLLLGLAKKHKYYKIMNEIS
ncbi:MAG: DUF1616 domain-containing protein [Nitrososphaerales archaeon]